MNGAYHRVLDRQHERELARLEYLETRHETDVENFLCGLDVDAIDKHEACEQLTEIEGLHALVLAAIQGNARPLEDAYKKIAKWLWKQSVVEKELEDDGY